MNRWHFLALLLCLIAWRLLAAAPARAHAEVERSNPPADAVLAQAPSVVELWFTQELFRREGENRLEVTGADGARVDQGDARLDDDDRTHMLVSLLPDLPDGIYTVHWRTLSLDDGHGEEGNFRFTVSSQADPAAAASPAPATVTVPAVPTSVATPSPPPAAPPTPTGAPASGALPCLGAVLLGGVGLVAVGGRKRR